MKTIILVWILSGPNGITQKEFPIPTWATCQETVKNAKITGMAAREGGAKDSTVTVFCAYK